MLALIVKEDPRQKESLENNMAFGAFAQNLMLLLLKQVLVHVGSLRLIYLILKYVKYLV